MSKTGLILRISRRSSRILVMIKLLLTFVIIVSAAAITSTSKSFTAEIGSAATVPSNLLMTDRGFAIATASASANATSCTSPITFGSTASVGNNGMTSGDMVYTVRVNSTSNPPALTKYNVTFTLAATSYGPLCIQTAATPTNGQIIDCKFDIGTSTLPVSIYTFKVTIQ